MGEWDKTCGDFTFAHPLTFSNISPCAHHLSLVAGKSIVMIVIRYKRLRDSMFDIDGTSVIVLE